jgi:RNA methyltransferase, TrmH family
VITSTANPRVKAILRLGKRREREAAGRFVVEGRREVQRALAAGVELDELVTCPPLHGPPGGDGAAATAELVADAAAAGAAVTEVAESVFARLSHRQGPDGVLAVARTFPTDLDRLAPGPVPLVLVVAGLEKPGNLGSVLRSAAAAGADAVVVADPVTDLVNPNVVRASQGAVFAVPVAVAGAEATLAWLRHHGLPVFAAGPGGTTPHWALPLAGPAALVVGAEDRGLPETWFAAADRRVVIPMPGDRGVDSLGAAAAAAVLLFEAVRQRGGGGQAPMAPSNR